MNVHQQFDEDLTLFALGELTGERRLAVEQHLAECPDCRRELEQIWGDFALLSLSAYGPKPSAAARERFMAAIANEPRRVEPTAAPRRISWWRWLEWAAGATAAVAIAVLLIQNASLERHASDLEAQTTAQQQQLVQAKDVLASLASPEAEHFSLTASKAPPQPLGKVLYVRKSGMLVFLASNLAPVPPQKTYELWLIPASGAPIPAGLFKPGADGSATLIRPPLPPGVAAQTFAVSVEPETGSPSPTSTPVMVGSKG